MTASGTSKLTQIPSNFFQVPGHGCDGFVRESVRMSANAFTLASKGYSHQEAATLTTAGLTA